MWIVLSFNKQYLTGEKFYLTVLDVFNNCKNSLRFQRNTKLGLVIEGTLDSTRVKVDRHAL
ncbi:hypothetical protein CRI93_09425 [Longimonas halophila]|uniref:Uncharacterized protein n=1 Tax=Longimonas halophila TaxID=1469170 RepID=A0A2H3P4A9_9BACT|nr:hypothetical protein CRI93_09425 [Longimonas halophila]